MLIIGLSGVTNGGKTTLARALCKALPNCQLICQDDYFLPIDSPLHTWIPQLNHINWEIMSSLDMDKMWKDITKILHDTCSHSSLEKPQGDYDHTDSLEGNGVPEQKTVMCENMPVLTGIQNFCSPEELNKKILIIEGFLVLNYQPIADICHLKFHITLNKEECYKRRNERVYDPPDVQGFFDTCVWPEYVKHKEEMLENVKDVAIIDGTVEMNSTVEFVLGEIRKKIHSIDQ